METHSVDAELVMARERELLDPAVRRDRSLLLSLLHPDFVEYGASGRVWSGNEILVALAADPETAGEPVDVASYALACDVILVTYRLLGVCETLRSSLWIRVDDDWRLRFHQGTPVSEIRAAPG
jgi:ribonuclease HI